jgi:polyhydroxyalkanoate synthesis regulator phasin
MSPHSQDPQHDQDAGDVEQPTLAAWLVDRVVAHQALRTILEENRRVHSLEDRVERLERRLRALGEDPRTM